MGIRVELSLLGLDRHDWGAIHLYLGFLLLALLVLHIVLHWNMIPGLFARLVAPSRQRWQIALVYVLLTAALLLFPFLISPEVKDGDAGQGRRYGAQGEIGTGRVRCRTTFTHLVAVNQGGWGNFQKILNAENHHGRK